MTLTQTADKLKEKPTHKCLHKILGHHQLEQPKSSLALILQVSLSILEVLKTILPKAFPSFAVLMIVVESTVKYACPKSTICVKLS